jgi:Winged helix DNA-binding domain
MHAQRLTPQQPDTVQSVAQIVKELCGLQAQDAHAATLAVRPRSDGLLATDIEHALIQERSIIRTWGQRGTLHLLATEDIDWLLSLLGPIFVAASQTRRAELGLDEETCSRGIQLLRNVLANQGALTRAEIVEQLAMRGIRLEGQAAPHLIGRAALEGIVCLGPDHGGKPTYVLLDDWIRRGRVVTLSRDEACAELALRYLSAYGPAAPDDFASWSGLPISEARLAWKHVEPQLIEVEIAGRPAWLPKTNAAWLDEFPIHSPVVRLLPSFDTYLLGYRKRDLIVESQYAKRIHPGGGILHQTLIVDGWAVGTWKSKRQKNHLDIIVEPFDTLSAEIHRGLEAEVTDIARFLGVQTVLHIVASP